MRMDTAQRPRSHSGDRPSSRVSEPDSGGRSSPATPRASSPTSSFNVSLMPTNAIQRRTLHPFSVHFSTQTGRWIATIVRVVDGEQLPPDSKRCIQTFFSTEREARKFAKCFSPPKMIASSRCIVCSTTFTNRVRPNHCRNCGASICDKCSRRWGIRMIPRTYVLHSNAVTVRVCKSCDWLSNAFCLALLQGKLDDAMMIYETGNVNLRSTFAGINGEAMFPVHCAVMGGNVDILKWLVDGHCCPVAIKQDPRLRRRRQSLQTSGNRSLIDLSMTGKPKLEILRYLVMEKNLSVLDTKDPSLAPRTLEALLRAGGSETTGEPIHPMIHVIDDQTTHSGTTTLDDACIICCERAMDCVLIPCGHQVCCQECGNHLQACPVCKIDCSVLRIYRY